SKTFMQSLPGCLARVYARGCAPMDVLRTTILSLGLMLPLVGSAAEPAATGGAKSDAQVRELGRAWLDNNNGVGLSIGIYDGTQRRFYNFGTTQQEGNRAPTKDTVYELGSISKSFAGQLLDNTPDLTQVRMVPGEPLAATRMKVIARYKQEEFLRQLHRIAPRAAPGSDPAYSNV